MFVEQEIQKKKKLQYSRKKTRGKIHTHTTQQQQHQQDIDEEKKKRKTTKFNSTPRQTD